MSQFYLVSLLVVACGIDVTGGVRFLSKPASVVPYMLLFFLFERSPGFSAIGVDPVKKFQNETPVIFRKSFIVFYVLFWPKIVVQSTGNFRESGFKCWINGI